jgi:hypothetical protein
VSAKRWILFLLWLAAVPCAAQAGEAAQTEDLGQACTYHRPTFDPASADTPKPMRAGAVTVNGFNIPAYGISLSNPLRASGFATYTPGKRGPKIRLTPEMAGRLEAYATPMGTILVPGGWTPRSGAEGADGSFVIYFTPDAGGESYMSVESTAACVGCAYSSASWYFKSARALARDNGFAYCRSAAGVHSVPLNPVQRAYRIKTAQGNPVDGLAYFNPDDDLMFYEVEISLPAAQHALATAVLNQFVIARKSK